MHFGESFREHLLGREVNLPIAVLTGEKQIQVLYTYYEGKPRSHRLEFKKGNRVCFEVYLPNYGESISQLCAEVNELTVKEDGCKNTLSFMMRLILRITAGRPVFCHDILGGPSTSFSYQHGEAISAYRYQLAYCVRGEKDSIVLIASRHGRQYGTYRKGKTVELKWIQLSMSAFKTLVEYLNEFMNGEKFRNLTFHGDGSCGT